MEKSGKAKISKSTLNTILIVLGVIVVALIVMPYLGEKDKPFILLHPSDYGRFRRNGNIKSEDEDMTLNWLLHKSKEYKGDE